jgi:hypothetical protein
MEMRNNDVDEFKQRGDVMRWEEFKNDFLKQSFEGVKIVDSSGHVRRDVMYDEIINEINRSEIKSIYYIPSQLAAKILYTNNKYDMMYRE